MFVQTTVLTSDESFIVSSIHETQNIMWERKINQVQSKESAQSIKSVCSSKLPIQVK